MSRGSKKKKPRAGRPRLDWTAYLRGQGVAPGPVTPEVDAAAALLAGTSDTLPEITLEVAEALCAALGADGKLDLLARCTAEGTRELAKAARRELHAQRRRGADVPRVQSRPTDARVESAADEHADARAHLSTPFGGGHRILIFRFRGTTDRVLHAAMADLSDTQGLRDLQLYRGGAKVYRTMVTESKTKLPGASISFGRALYLVQRAVALTRTQKRLVPDHVSTLRKFLGAHWPVSDAHPAAGLTPAEVPSHEPLFALWELAELRTWTPAEETLSQLTEGIAEVLESKLVVVELQRAQRLQELVGKAVATELEGDGLDRWAERLLDAAWVMHGQHPRQAAELLGVHQQLRQTDNPGELAFFQQLVGRLLLGRLPPELAVELIPGLAPVQPSDEPAQPDPGGVIWTPGSSNEPTGGGKGGSGGLIIPGR